MKSLPLAALTCLLALAPGSAGAANAKTKGGAKPINQICPVSDEPVNASKVVAYSGETIGFCCDKCLANFNKDPKKFAGKIVADAK